MKPLQIVSPLHKAMRRMSIHLGKKVQEQGLEGNDGHLLSFVAAYGPSKIAELRQVFGHKPSTLTSLLDRLERRGFVVRSIDPEDRRGFLIETTAAGARAGRQARKVVEDFEKKVLARIRPRDLAAFQRVLDALGEETQVHLRKE